MQHHEFLARVRELGEYDSQDEAAKVTEPSSLSDRQDAGPWLRTRKRSVGGRTTLDPADVPARDL